MSTNNQNQVIKYSSFDPSRMVPERAEIKGADADSQQQILSYAKYIGANGRPESFKLQTPEVTLFERGVPQRPGPNASKKQIAAFTKYFSDDAKRCRCQVPEDVNDEKCAALFAKMEELDAYLDSPEFRELFLKGNTFVKDHKTLRYDPVVRTPDPDDNIDKDGNPKKRWLSFKFLTDFATNKIKTSVLVKNGNVRTKIDGIETIDDVAKYANYKSKVTLVLVPSKLFIDKKKTATAPQSYGIKFKISSICCVPSVYEQHVVEDEFVDDEDTGTAAPRQMQFNTSAKMNVATNDDDNDDETQPVATSKRLGLDDDEDNTAARLPAVARVVGRLPATTRVPVAVAGGGASAHNSDDDVDNDVDNDDSEPTPPPPPKAPAKVVAKRAGKK